MALPPQAEDHPSEAMKISRSEKFNCLEEHTI